MGVRIDIRSLEDARLAPYRALKERELAREGGRFIAEGEQVVRRLVDSSIPVDSVLLAQRRAEEMSPIVPGSVPVYVVPDELVEQIMGFQFHSGVMAVGIRPARKSMEDVLRRDAQSIRLVICPETANTENLGGMIRIAAAFGVDAMILGERSCDPFFRQAVRVSMGTIFRLPIIQSQCLLSDLDQLKREWGVELIATVTDGSESLADSRPSSRWALLFGNEAQGLSGEVVARCQRRIRIPMKLGTDSLNVMVAAGIFLHHFANG